MDYTDKEVDSYEIMEVQNRAILLDTRTGASWILCGVETDKPHWKPIRWTDKAEKEPGK